MGRKFKLTIFNMKEITRECLRVGDLVRLAIYGKIGLKRAIFLGCGDGTTFFFLMVGDNLVVEFGPNAHWILNRIYLESRNEESFV